MLKITLEKNVFHVSEHFPSSNSKKFVEIIEFQLCNTRSPFRNCQTILFLTTFRSSAWKAIGMGRTQHDQLFMPLKG